MDSSLFNHEILKNFKLDRILSEDPLNHTLALLGSISTSESHHPKAILRIERTALSSDILQRRAISDTVVTQSTDIYTKIFGWFATSEDRNNPDGKGADVVVNVICPATEDHVRKYTFQKLTMIHETPDLYERIVKPYIDSFPKSRTQWVDNILAGTSEKSKVLVSNPDFLILPDLKWDTTTVSTLYLLAIAHPQRHYSSPSGTSELRFIKSMRDLKADDIPWLKKIRSEAHRIVLEKWGLNAGSIRCYVHYQPSYYHFHVHIVNANYIGLVGMTVGQAWLLDDIISLIAMDPPGGTGIMRRMTFTYGLGNQHGLFEALHSVQGDILL